MNWSAARPLKINTHVTKASSTVITDRRAVRIEMTPRFAAMTNALTAKIDPLVWLTRNGKRIDGFSVASDRRGAHAAGPSEGRGGRGARSHAGAGAADAARLAVGRKGPRSSCNPAPLSPTQNRCALAALLATVDERSHVRDLSPFPRRLHAAAKIAISQWYFGTNSAPVNDPLFVGVLQCV